MSHFLGTWNILYYKIVGYNCYRISVKAMGERLTEDFLHLFVEKNSDGTRNLRLKGRELYQRIGKRLVAKDMKRVAEFLSDYPQIIKLDVCYNDIGDEGIQNLVDGYLSKQNDLEYLNIRGCSLSHAAVAKLYETRNTLELTTLRLSSNKLGPESGRHLAKLLDFSQTLLYLDIGDTDQTIFSVCGILSRLTYSSLEVIDVSRVIPINMYAQTDSAELAVGFANVLEYNEHLVELHLQKCEMDGHDVELLLEGLYRNKTLLLLDLGFNKIGDHGLELISKWLRTRPSLLGLNVAGNRIKDNGAKMLSLCMPFSKVRFLDITYNRITDKGMLHVLHSIKKPYQLRILYLWGNSFGEPTHKIIRRMLLSGVLHQEYIDIKLYMVDKVLYAAYYPTNRFKHKYYGVMNHGCECAAELKIIKNYIATVDSTPRALIDFVHMDRYPPIQKVLPDSMTPEEYLGMFDDWYEGEETDESYDFVQPSTSKDSESGEHSEFL